MKCQLECRCGLDNYLYQKLDVGLPNERFHSKASFKQFHLVFLFGWLVEAEPGLHVRTARKSQHFAFFVSQEREEKNFNKNKQFQ